MRAYVITSASGAVASTVVIPPPADDNDAFGDNSVDAYPPAPSDEGVTATYPGESKSDTVKRQPLDEASIEPAQPGQGEVMQVIERTDIVG